MGAKWFIYMTDQGIMFLTVHYTLDALLVIRRYVAEKFYDDGSQTCKFVSEFLYLLINKSISGKLILK